MKFFEGFLDGFTMAGIWNPRLYDRRTFLKGVSVTAVAGAVVPTVLGETNERGYDSATISIRLVEEAPDITSLLLIEHGDADYAIVEAFYWTTVEIAGAPHRVLLHEEATSTLIKEMGCATNVRLPVESIVFLRVKELNLLRLNEFGKVPKHDIS